MDALPSHQYERLYGALQGALLGVAEERNSTQTLKRAIAAVWTCVHAAVADMSQRWNASNEDPIQRLPAELRVHCFKRLVLRDRIAVSHVSRDWRATALSAPALWNTFEIDHPPDVDRAEVVLRALLDRSRAATFNFRWQCQAQIPEPILALVSDNMSRMNSLTIDYQHVSLISALLSHPAPQLRVLDIARTNGVWQIPSRWPGDTPPPLWYLATGAVSLPSVIRPLLSLRCLTCKPPVDSRRLFELCPNLEEVGLFGLQESSLLPPSVPHSLEMISVSAGDGTDVMTLLLPWKGHRFRSVLANTVKFVPIVEFFLATGSSCWEMSLASGDRNWQMVSVNLKADDNRYLKSVLPAAQFPKTPLHKLAPHLRSLTALSIEFNSTLITFWGRGGIALPSLTHLTLTLGDETIAYLHMYNSPVHPIPAPRLQNLILVCEPGSSISALVTVTLRHLDRLLTREYTLEQVTVVIPYARHRLAHDWSTLLERAPLLYVRDKDSGETFVLQRA